MPKKFSDADKLKWLELSERGKTEIQIAREHAKCDARTVRRGIEEARRKQDARVARVELLKEALRRHQDSLYQELDGIISGLTLPAIEYAVLSWYHDGDSVLEETRDSAGKKRRGDDVNASEKDSRSTVVTMQSLLKEHLKGDRIWKVVALYQKVYKANLDARVLLQRKIIAMIQDKTGCNVVDKSDLQKPFVYSYTTGDLFYKTVIRLASGIQTISDIEDGIVVNAASGDVRYHSMVLAEAPGNEEKIKLGLLDAFKVLKESPEAISVVDTSRTLEEAATAVRQVVEQIKLLGMIPGRCEICRRLGV